MTRSAKLKWWTELIEYLEEKNDNINEILANFNLVFIPIQAKLELINALLNRCSQNPKPNTGRKVSFTYSS